MTYTGIDNDIDSVLDTFFKRQTEVYDSAIRGKHNDDALIEHMQLSGLIKKYSAEKNSYILLPFGFEVIRSGGWKKYLDEKESDRKLNQALIRSSIRTNSLQKVLLWFTLGFSFASFVVSWLDYSVHAAELRILKSNVELEGTPAQSLRQSSETSQTPMDSSKTPTDSSNVK